MLTCSDGGRENVYAVGGEARRGSQLSGEAEGEGRGLRERGEREREEEQQHDTTRSSTPHTMDMYTTTQVEDGASGIREQTKERE